MFVTDPTGNAAVTSDGGNPVLGYRSKTDLVTDYLRAELLAGRPAPGERLVVSQVAATLGISKIPVREAVTRLIGEGLLTTRPNVGPVVPEFTAHEVIETALMRVAIEGAAMDSAVPLHTHATLRSLRDLHVRMNAADAEFPRLNVEFHLAVIAPSPYQEMVRTAQALLERARRYSTVHRVAGYRPQAHAEHAALVEALEEGDTPRLKALNERHIMEAARRLTELMT